MSKIALIGCTGSKELFPCCAIELYSKSSLFRKEKAFAEKVLGVNKIYILSAEHGLVAADKELKPYNTTLNKMKIKERKEWTLKVFNQIKNTFNVTDEFYFLCGKKYYEFLLPEFETYKMKYDIPLRGKGRIGEQLSWLSKQIGEADL